MKKILAFRKTKLYAMIIILLVVAIVMIISSHEVIKAQANSSVVSLYEQKVYADVSIDDDFDKSSILVVMDKYTSGFNKSHTSIFSRIPLVRAIKDLTSLTGNLNEKLYLNKINFRQIIEIDLKEHSKQNVINTINKIQELDGVLWAGVNNNYDLTDLPETKPPAMSGGRYFTQWGLYSDFGINALEAWNYTQGTRNTKIGIIDTGIANHPDLSNNVSQGWNFVDDNDNTDDTYGHGTAVAGIIGANGSSDNGVIGVNWKINMIPLKADYYDNELQKYRISGSAIIKAITWAIDKNIDMLNASFGSYTENIAQKTALSNFNGLVICSSGNNGYNIDETRHYPSDYSQGQEFSNRIISVGATTMNKEIWKNTEQNVGTNYGKNTVSIFAPGGESIVTTSPTGYNDNFGGTSAAAPFVTGVAALLYCVYGNNLQKSTIATDIKTTILEFSTKDDRYTGKCVSGGRVNAGEALKNIQYIKEVMLGFGYNDGSYRWDGKVDLHFKSLCHYEINKNNDLVITSDTIMNFFVGTYFCFNAVTSIYCDITMSLCDNNGNTIQSSSFDMRAGILSIVYRGGGITFDTSTLQNGKYTIVLECNTTRKNTKFSQTVTYSFYVDK